MAQGPTATELDEFEATLLARLRQVYAGKRWLVAGEVLQGIAGGALVARDLGAQDVLALGCRLGVGDIDATLRFVVSGESKLGDESTMVERMHDSERELHNLSARVQDEVDDWDPEQQAQAIVSFTIAAGKIAGRPTFGARKPEWAALEDKISIRELWGDAGITTAPDQVVDLDDVNGLIDAHRYLSSSRGSVWAVDNDQGWHGGGKGTYWIPDEAHARETASKLAKQHRRVRVQPFLSGVPCSVHGMVLAGSTLAFRPCEMLVLLDEPNRSIEYSRAATFWDPPDNHRAAMRSMARAVGDAMRDRVDYRGVFTLDGVITSDGFRPTEVNPRFGAALPPRIPAADDNYISLFFTHLAAATGNLDDLDPVLLEGLIVDRLDNNRMGTAFIETEHAPADGEQKVAVAGTLTNGKFVDLREATDNDRPLATASWGSNPGGGLIFAVFTDEIPTGPSVAPTLISLRRFLSSHWDLDLPEFVAPT